MWTSACTLNSPPHFLPPHLCGSAGATPHTHIDVPMYTHISHSTSYAYTQKGMPVYTHGHVHMYVHTYTCTVCYSAYACAHTFMHSSNIHTHTHAHPNNNKSRPKAFSERTSCHRPQTAVSILLRVLPAVLLAHTCPQQVLACVSAHLLTRALIWRRPVVMVQLVCPGHASQSSCSPTLVSRG